MDPPTRLPLPATRIAIFRALVLGDLLCSIPALRALRATWPDAHVALVGLPSMAGFVARYPHYVDEFIPFPGAPGFPEQDERGDGLPAFLDAMRARRLDLAIQLHGSGGPANLLVRGFGAARTVGFHLPQVHDENAGRDAVVAAEGAGRLDTYVDWDAETIEVRKYLALMRELGAAPAVVDDTSLELPILPADVAEWTRVKVAHGLEGATIVCLHPGARWSSRRWPLDRFAAVGATLAGRGARLVVTGSPDETPLAAALGVLLRARSVPFVDLSGRTSLGALAAMLRESRLLVCNDTGVSHVAAAVGASSVVVASGSDVGRWAPIDVALHPVLAHQVPCRPCMYRDCPIDHPCANGVTVEAVVSAALGHASLNHDFAASPLASRAA